MGVGVGQRLREGQVSATEQSTTHPPAALLCQGALRVPPLPPPPMQQQMQRRQPPLLPVPLPLQQHRRCRLQLHPRRQPLPWQWALLPPAQECWLPAVHLLLPAPPPPVPLARQPCVAGAQPAQPPATAGAWARHRQQRRLQRCARPASREASRNSVSEGCMRAGADDDWPCKTACLTARHALLGAMLTAGAHEHRGRYPIAWPHLGVGRCQPQRCQCRQHRHQLLGAGRWQQLRGGEKHGIGGEG